MEMMSLLREFPYDVIHMTFRTLISAINRQSNSQQLIMGYELLHKRKENVENFYLCCPY